MNRLSTPAVEKSTYIVTVAFTNEDGDSVIPNSGLNWSLSDLEGNIVNSRTAVALTPAATVNIILSGLDLALVDGKDTYRVLTVEGTYNSLLGGSLPIKDSVVFLIRNLRKVS